MLLSFSASSDRTSSSATQAVAAMRQAISVCPSSPNACTALINNPIMNCRSPAPLWPMFSISIVASSFRISRTAPERVGVGFHHPPLPPPARLGLYPDGQEVDILCADGRPQNAADSFQELLKVGPCTRREISRDDHHDILLLVTTHFARLRATVSDLAHCAGSMLLAGLSLG